LCLEDTGLLPASEVYWYYKLLYTYEHDYVNLLVYDRGPFIYIRVRVGLECLEPLHLVVEACEDEGSSLLKHADDPEVSKIVVETGCVRLYVPFEPVLRVKRMLEKLGITGPLRILDYYAETG